MVRRALENCVELRRNCEGIADELRRVALRLQQSTRVEGRTLVVVPIDQTSWQHVPLARRFEFELRGSRQPLDRGAGRGLLWLLV